MIYFVLSIDTDKDEFRIFQNLYKKDFYFFYKNCNYIPLRKVSILLYSIHTTIFRVKRWNNQTQSMMLFNRLSRKTVA
jgi:hypothetical protein